MSTPTRTAARTRTPSPRPAAPSRRGPGRAGTVPAPGRRPSAPRGAGPRAPEADPAARASTTASRRAYSRRQDRTRRWHPSLAAESSAVARVPFVALVIVLLAAGLVATLWLSTSSAQASYEIGAAQDRNTQLSERAQALRRDVATRGSASALAQAAAALGMVPAGTVAHLVVAADGTVTLVGTPTPASGTPGPALIAATTRAQAAVSPVSPATAPTASTAPSATAPAATAPAAPAAPVGIQPGADPAANTRGA